MKVHVWCELVCRTCSTVITGQFTKDARVPKESLIADAMKQGALFKDLEPFCGRACLNAYLKEKANERRPE